MNKTLIIKFLASVSLLVLIVLGMVFPMSDVPLAIAFLIPIGFFSVQKNVRLIFIVGLAALTSISWMITYLLLMVKTFDIQILLYTFIRFLVYLSISYLLMTLKRQYDELPKK